VLRLDAALAALFLRFLIEAGSGSAALADLLFSRALMRV